MGIMPELAGSLVGSGAAGAATGAFSSQGSQDPTFGTAALLNNMNGLLTTGSANASNQLINYTGQAENAINTGQTNQVNALNTGLTNANAAVTGSLNNGLTQYQALNSPIVSAGNNALDALTHTLGLGNATGNNNVTSNQLQQSLFNANQASQLQNQYQGYTTAPTAVGPAPSLSDIQSQFTINNPAALQQAEQQAWAPGLPNMSLAQLQQNEAAITNLYGANVAATNVSDPINAQLNTNAQNTYNAQMGTYNTQQAAYNSANSMYNQYQNAYNALGYSPTEQGIAQAYQSGNLGSFNPSASQ